MTEREFFERYYLQAGGSCLASVKEAHWNTWQAAQSALIAANGPAVEIKYLHETAPIDDEAWHRLRGKG